ncbi:MAG: J domain-containing protein [Armatimonadota bacterium]
MPTYYEILNITPHATPREVEASFRRFIARYRITLSVEELAGDKRFQQAQNAYLTLKSPLRVQYDNVLHGSGLGAPTPLDSMSPVARQLFLARIAYWRRESVQAMHLLRLLLEKEPQLAEGWALLGEINLTVGRLEEGIKAYERAVQAAPDTAAYSARLQHARDAQAGKVGLRIEASPQEELLREERRKRWSVTAVIAFIGLGIIGASFLLLLSGRGDFSGLLNLPWKIIGVQAAGLFVFMLALGYGRLIQSFERTMVWSSMAAGDRGHMRQYPYGIILFVTGAASMWLGTVTVIIMAMMEDEWPVSTIIMMLLCALLNAGLGAFLYLHHLPWGYTVAFGGNVPLMAAMLGWWMGTLGMREYD